MYRTSVAPPLALDPEMVNVKPPNLADLEIESMKKFILDDKRYSYKCLRQLIRNTQQFILEEYLDIIASESGGDFDDVMHLERDDFIGIMLRMHQAYSSRKWRLMVKMRKWNNPISLYRGFVQDIEDLRFWVNAAGRVHRLTEK